MDTRIIKTFLNELSPEVKKKKLREFISVFKNDPTPEMATTVLETLCQLQDILTPAETFDSLENEYPGRNFLFKWLDDATHLQYASLLSTLGNNGLPIEKITAHLEKENHQGKTILHFANLEKFSVLLRHLKGHANVDVDNFHHLLLKKDHDGKSARDKIAQVSPTVFLNLLTAGVIGEDDYTALESQLNPLLSYIEKLPKDEKVSATENLNDDKHPLYKYVLAIITLQTKSLIKKFSHSKHSSDLDIYLRALQIQNIPASIKLAALAVRTTASLDDYVNDNASCCESYCQLLKSIVTSPETALAVLNILTNYIKKIRNFSANEFGLFKKLFEHGVSANQIYSCLQQCNKLRFRASLYHNTSYVFLNLLSTMSANKENADAVFKIIELCGGVATLANRVTACVKENNLHNQYIDLLVSLAEANANTAKSIALALGSVLQEFVIRKIDINFYSLTRLLIALKRQGISTDDLDSIWLAENNIMNDQLITAAKQDTKLLFNLLRGDALPSHAYEKLKSCKEKLLEYIKSLPLNERVGYLLKACTPGNPFYKFMSMQRGFCKTQAEYGSLGEINDLLTSGIANRSYMPAILQLCGKNVNKTPQEFQDKLIYLAKKSPQVFISLFRVHLIPKSAFVELANDGMIRARFISSLTKFSEENKLTLFLNAESGSRPSFKTFMHAHPELEGEYSKYVKALFGDQSAVLAAISKDAAAEKERRKVSAEELEAQNEANLVTAQTTQPEDRLKQYRLEHPDPATFPVTDIALVHEADLVDRRAMAMYPNLYSLTYNELPPKAWVADVPQAAQVTIAPASTMFPPVPADDSNLTIDDIDSLEHAPKVPASLPEEELKIALAL